MRSAALAGRSPRHRLRVGSSAPTALSSVSVGTHAERRQRGQDRAPGDPGAGDQHRRLRTGRTSGSDGGQPLAVEERHARGRRRSPSSSQNRMMTVVSAQPTSSKWWWNGAIRNTRRPVVRNARICTTTEVTSATNSAPSTTASISVRLVDRQPGDDAAERQRAGVAHEDLGRRGVPPQEADARAGGGRRDERQVQRVADVVAAQARELVAQALRNCQKVIST